MLSSRSASPPDKQQPAGPLRRLLPASADEEKASHSKPPSRSTASSVSSITPPAPARRKRGQATTAACGACRKRKSKCDGGRPKCAICRDRGTVCEFDTNATETHTQALKRKYSELQNQKSAFEQIYDVLQTRTDKEAGEVFQRIRRGADAGSILRHVNYGDVLVQLALVPEARYRYEFPYLPDMPPFLRRPDNPYLDSEVYECALRGPQDPAYAQPQQHRLLPDAGNGVSSNGSVYWGGQQDPYLKPYLSATVVHPWLDSVKPSRWTAVSSDDGFMRKLLHDYFLFEYDWFTFFHKDYFLQDMAAEQARFCSELLVNAVLCLGCFCHRGLRGRAEFWNPRNVGYQFLAESKRLFELESELERPVWIPDDPYSERRQMEWEQRRLTTIQAALMITLIYDLNGSDKIGWRYTVQAIEMAHEIQLLGPPLAHHGPEMECVRTYTAWALFCWQSLQSYHYLNPPCIKEPPKTPLPDPMDQPQWYGELWIKYPLNPTRLPTYHGLLFKAKADYWTIITEFLLLTLSRPRATARLPVHQIFGFYNRFRAWLHGLPEPLTPRKIVLPHQLKLHMHYHIIMIDLFSPIMDCNGSEGFRLCRMPRDLYIEAVTHFETLLRLYYLRHGFEACDSFLIHFLGTLNHLSMNAIVSGADSAYLESRRSTIMLTTKGIYDQGRCHFIARAVLRLQVSLMPPEEVALLRRHVEMEEEQLIYGPLEQAVCSDWPVYEIGLEAKAEQWRQGRKFSSSLASLSVGPGTSPAPTRSPT
ncbi:Nitrogen assimilation transcription factor [Madurella fahalii]|uniref:Nitrogen assimilation transcription factor n=1 Tax=Madurella fahalii TaxID=1157608 RepID=A0ABQ0FZW1_9PEZI